MGGRPAASIPGALRVGHRAQCPRQLAAHDGTTGRVAEGGVCDPAGERHELGLLCSALLASSAGYGVIYLGPDVPAVDIAHAAATTGAQVVMVSATTPGVVTKGEAKQLTRLPPGVELWAGGPEAHVLLDAGGERARHVESLDDVLPMLSRHAR